MAGFPSTRALAVVAAAVLAASFLAPGRPALAEPTPRIIAQTCLPHAEIAAKLLSDFKEAKLGHGISADGNLVEVFIAPAGTFTVVKTTPRGVSCIVDFGEGWQTIDQFETAWLDPVPDIPERFGR